jgi:hypothetical protein
MVLSGEHGQPGVGEHDLAAGPSLPRRPERTLRRPVHGLAEIRRARRRSGRQRARALLPPGRRRSTPKAARERFASCCRLGWLSSLASGPTAAIRPRAGGGGSQRSSSPPVSGDAVVLEQLIGRPRVLIGAGGAVDAGGLVERVAVGVIERPVQAAPISSWRRFSADRSASAPPGVAMPRAVMLSVWPAAACPSPAWTGVTSRGMPVTAAAGSASARHGERFPSLLTRDSSRSRRRGVRSFPSERAALVGRLRIAVRLGERRGRRGRGGCYLRTRAGRVS